MCFFFLILHVCGGGSTFFWCNLFYGLCQNIHNSKVKLHIEVNSDKSCLNYGLLYLDLSSLYMFLLVFYCILFVNVIKCVHIIHNLPFLQERSILCTVSCTLVIFFFSHSCIVEFTPCQRIELFLTLFCNSYRLHCVDESAFI